MDLEKPLPRAGGRATTVQSAYTVFASVVCVQDKSPMSLASAARVMKHQYAHVVRYCGDVADSPYACHRMPSR